ncbi:H(+)/Cl(-) exchange transporter ClcA [Klebsiella pneumoniae IS46]|nr:H(+)/Cl(-) exchange transporter ClcA [Klebsiella pneumoniae IS46]
MCRKGIFLTTQRAGTAKMPLSSFVLPIIDNGMKAETPSFEAHQFVRVRRGDAVRRLIQRDKKRRWRCCLWRQWSARWRGWWASPLKRA